MGKIYVLAKQGRCLIIVAPLFSSMYLYSDRFEILKRTTQGLGWSFFDM